MAKKQPRAEAHMRFSRGVRGLDRAAHFESGGTLEAWRGKKTITVDRKKEASMRACRKKAQPLEVSDE